LLFLPLPPLVRYLWIFISIGSFLPPIPDGVDGLFAFLRRCTRLVSIFPDPLGFASASSSPCRRNSPAGLV
jgi:hypothetical protein